MGLITDICFSIDAYNNVERSDNKTLMVKLRQRSAYKNLKKVIKKFESDIRLDVDMLNDFYFNYMATIDTIGELDNCECIYNENQLQFIFSIKNSNGAVAFSTYKAKNPAIDVTVSQYGALETKSFKYSMDFKPRANVSQAQNDLGDKCELLLKDCIVKYLTMRLDLFKEEKNVKEK